VLVWESAACNIFSVTTTQASYGKCGDTNTAAENIQPAHLAIISVWEQKYKSFEAETPAGKVTFTGKGISVATPSEQRMMAEWASLNYDIASSGRAGAAWGLALAWHREGGIAGFCNDVNVYQTGLYMASSCQLSQPAAPLTGYLTATQLDQLYGWIDSLQTVDYSYTDPAVADAMTTKLIVASTGAKPASDEVIQSIGAFAAEIDTVATFKANAPSDALEAQQSLKDFFAALNSGDYIQGAKLYGGDTSLLATWNPDVKNDLPKWLELGCKQNGLQCLLPRTITYRGPDARGGYQFYIKFNASDGTFFRQGGDVPGSVRNFIFSVIKQNELWLVMDLPPYVP